MEQPEADKNGDNPIDLNQALIDQLKEKGLIQSARIEAAFREVLRHQFLPGTPLKEAYSDRAISAKQDADGRWLSSSSQPAIMAIMLEQLDLQPGHKVLEIGAGTGYNAALMAHIVGTTGNVITIDIDQDIVDAARERLTLAGFEQVQVVCADGGYGFAEAAPYDRIILTVGAPDIAPSWWEQLKPDGRMVLPLLLQGSMKSIAFEQVKDHLVSRSISDCGFIPLRGDFALPTSGRVQAGPEPGLYLESMGEIPIESDAVYGLLSEAGRDWPANVDVAAWDVLNGGLWTWLALHEPHMCKLVAENEMVDRNIVPPLIGVEGRLKSVATAVLLDNTGLAALTRDQALPLIPMDKLFTPDSPANQPFALFVRQFGSDESLAQRLIAQIQAWEAASRPSIVGIRAYRKSSDYTPAKDEFVLEKKWTKLVIGWPASS